MTEEVSMEEATGKGSARPSDDGKDAGRAAVTRAARGEELDGNDERGALEFLLGAPAALEYEITVDYETDAGMLPLTFHFKGMDAGAIDKIEQQHLDDRTGQLDKIGADCTLVTKATTKIVDSTGAEINPRDEAFRTTKEGERPLANAADAMRVRFGAQAGLLSGIASAIRIKAGYDAERVGRASRLLVQAAGN
jgi:hypothetical protein